MEELFCEFRIKVTELRIFETSTEDRERTTAEIEYDRRECLIHRYTRFTVAFNPGFIAERFRQRCPENDRCIFDRMVRIDPRITFCCHLQTDPGLKGE